MRRHGGEQERVNKVQPKVKSISIQRVVKKLLKLANGVDCNGCTTCCTSKQHIYVFPHEGDNEDDYDLNPARWCEDYQMWARTIKHNEEGHCMYAVEAGCAIWSKRPFFCRIFDCRMLVLAGPDRTINQDMLAEGVKRAQVYPGGVDGYIKVVTTIRGSVRGAI